MNLLNNLSLKKNNPDQTANDWLQVDPLGGGVNKRSKIIGHRVSLSYCAVDNDLEEAGLCESEGTALGVAYLGLIEEARKVPVHALVHVEFEAT